MSGKSVRAVVSAAVAVALVFAFVAVAPASAGQAPGVAEPLAFLAGCPAPGASAPPAELPPLDLQTLSPSVPECRGCSVHNCYYQRVGSRCSAGGQLGRCTVSQWCPEIRETSCTCEPV